MESDNNNNDNGGSSSDGNFGFGYNDRNFSDRLLRIEIMGDEAGDGLASKGSVDYFTVVRVKTLHINSLILAAKSPYFLKLFSNGMRESEQQEVTLRVNECEEGAFMELLHFMYSNTVSTSTAPGLLELVVIADKFQVTSCMKYCSELLLKLPMTPEYASLYLALPSNVFMAEIMQPLTDAAKQYLVVRYKDMTKFQEELMALSLPGIKTILSSNDLQVASEDKVYDLVLKWATSQFPKPEERRKVLGTHLAGLIRYPYMTWQKLNKVLECNDFDFDVASKLVLEALLFKAAPLCQQQILTLASKESAPSTHRFVRRVYVIRPLKVMEFELPRQQCVVYVDLKRDECLSLFPSGNVIFQKFHLGEQGFCLTAVCTMNRQNSSHCFGLCLGMMEKGSVSFDFEFAARSKPTEEFVRICKTNRTCTFANGLASGFRYLVAMPWTSFTAEDSVYFINNVLHLRADFTIRH